MNEFEEVFQEDCYSTWKNCYLLRQKEVENKNDLRWNL